MNTNNLKKKHKWDFFTAGLLGVISEVREKRISEIQRRGSKSRWFGRLIRIDTGNLHLEVNTAIWVEVPGSTLDLLEGLYLPTRLGSPGDPPRGARGSCQGGLGVSAATVATVTLDGLKGFREWMDGWTHEQMDRWMDWHMDRWIHGWMDRCLDRCLDGRRHGCMDRWMGAWTDGWTSIAISLWVWIYKRKDESEA